MLFDRPAGTSHRDSGVVSAAPLSPWRGRRCACYPGGMRLLGPGLLSLAFALAAPTARAATPVTTGMTDGDDTGPAWWVTIVEPQDDAVIPGDPDAEVEVVLEFEAFDSKNVRFWADDGPNQTCEGQTSPCKLQVVLGPGPHTLNAVTHPDWHSIQVTVVGATDTTDTTAAPTTGEGTSTSADTSEPATDGEQPGGSSSTSDGAASASGGGGDGGDKGCACATGRGAPDLLGLAVFALLVPWRRRRR